MRPTGSGGAHVERLTTGVWVVARPERRGTSSSKFTTELAGGASAGASVHGAGVVLLDEPGPEPEVGSEVALRLEIKLEVVLELGELGELGELVLELELGSETLSSSLASSARVLSLAPSEEEPRYRPYLPAPE